jgi:hypothetical protein
MMADIDDYAHTTARRDGQIPLHGHCMLCLGAMDAGASPAGVIIPDQEN